MVAPLRFPCLRVGLGAFLLLTLVQGGAGAAKKAGGGTTASPLEIVIDRSKVDLREHRLEVKLSRKASKISIRVEGESGAVLAEEEQDFSGRAAGSPLIVTWTPSSDETVEKIEVKATDAFGFYTGMLITPYNFTIEHEDVSFKTGSSVIDDTEAPKLEAAHQKILAKVAAIRAKDINHQHRNLTLYIAGHTDTVGGFDYNIGLSRDRAHAIAGWFQKHGAPVPVAYEGFGESSPRVTTADNVDEPRNRRVDYIIADDPASASSILKTSGFKPTWKRSN
jgi:outer membrane protein OmpA-like peptidoglycan-associated protein